MQLIDRDTKGGQAQAFKQLEAIKKTNNTMDNKAKSKLSDFNLDNLAKALAFNGLKNQGSKGLLAQGKGAEPRNNSERDQQNHVEGIRHQGRLANLAATITTKACQERPERQEESKQRKAR